MSDFLADTGGDLVFEDDIVSANSKEAVIQFVISVLRTLRGDNKVYPEEGTLVSLRHGLNQSRETGEIIKRDIETGLIESGVAGSTEFTVEVVPTGASEIKTSIILDPSGFIFGDPIRVDFKYDVGTGAIEHLDGVIE